MKYIFIVPDGLADLPMEEFDGKTAVQVARTPNLDRMAREGRCGLAKNTPRGMHPGSDVACLSLLGYDPAKFYTGRGPLEAASQKIALQPDDIVFRCNCVTIFEKKMIDYSGGHISSKEAKVLIGLINDKFKREGLTFYPGVSYRNLMVIKESFLQGGKGEIKTVPPHDILDEEIEGYLPKGMGKDFLINLMQEASALIEQDDINKIKVDLGENPANAIWLWGQGKVPNMPLFEELHGLKGGVISAVDLVKGMSMNAGLSIIDVPGITGYLDTDYAAKGLYAVEAMKDYDFVFVHVEAPDEAGHNGDKMAKVQSIEQIDEKVVGPVLRAMNEMGGGRILVSPDHPTPIEKRTHTDDPVPFILWGEGVEGDKVENYSEADCKGGKFGIVKGHHLIPKILMEKK